MYIQRIRDRYIVNNAEFQVNLSGGMQHQTLQHFANDPQNLDWKSKMIERTQSCQKEEKQHNKLPNSLSLKNVPTTTHTNEDSKTVKSTPRPKRESVTNTLDNKMELTIFNAISSDDNKHNEDLMNGINHIITRFDESCTAIVHQILLHEFDRFKNTEDFRAYFKSYKRSKKHRGSFKSNLYRKFQKKTSRVLPSNHHQSSQITHQLSLHSANSLQVQTSLPKPKRLQLKKSASLHQTRMASSFTSLQKPGKSGHSINRSATARNSSRQSSTTRTSGKRRHSAEEFSNNMPSYSGGMFTMRNGQNSSSRPHSAKLSQSSTTKLKGKENRIEITTNEAPNTPTENDMDDIMDKAIENMIEDVTPNEESMMTMKHTKDVTFSSIVGHLNTRSVTAMSNRLSLIREHPKPVSVVGLGVKNKSLTITPVSMIESNKSHTPTVNQYGFPDMNDIDQL